jgi:hypothetical protein
MGLRWVVMVFSLAVVLSGYQNKIHGFQWLTRDTSNVPPDSTL